MSRHHKGKNSWKNKNHFEEKKVEVTFHKRLHEKIAESKERQEAIIALKQRVVMCSICGNQINDITSAMDDKNSGNPAHFDCVLSKLTKETSLREGENLTYIGQGRFAIIHYENKNEPKSFKIQKIIEYENKDAHSSWRNEMSELYSKVL